MPSSGEKTLNIFDLTGGICDLESSDKIKDNQLAYARNVYGFQNKILSRNGYQRLTVANISGANYIRGMGQIQAGLSNYNFGAWNNQLFKLTGETPGNVSATRIRNNFSCSSGTGFIGFDFFSFSGIKNVVICNGAQVPIRWDGTSAGCLVLSGNAPNTSDTFLNFNRYGLLYDFDALTIYQSNLGDANNGYAANAPIVIPAEKEGDIGSGMVQWGDMTLATTRRSVHRLMTTGIATAPFTRRRLSAEIGNMSHRALLAIDNGVFFVASTGIYFYDGSAIVRASIPIHGTWTNVNQQYLANACACNYKPKSWAMFAVPYGTSATTNNMILAYDYLNSVPSEGKFVWWIFDDITAQSMGIFRNSSFTDKCWTGDDNTHIFLQDSGLNDNGNAFTQSAWSKAFDFSSPNRDKRLHKCRYIVDASGNWNLSVSIDIDQRNSPSYQKLINCYAGGTLWGSFTWGVQSWATKGTLQPLAFYPPTCRGRFMQFRFSLSTINQFFALYRWMPTITIKDIRGRDMVTSS